MTVDYDFSGLGMSDKDETVFRKMINRPDGIILVTGPTGSGKSTTLYTALKELNKYMNYYTNKRVQRKLNVLTPMEYYPKMMLAA